MVNEDAALQYAGRGWYVFPAHSIRDGACTCGNSKCASAGKHPLTANGFKDATLAKEVIASWWATWPWANVAIATGLRSHVAVADLDSREGLYAFAAIAQEYALTSPLCKVRTGRGVHLYYPIRAPMETCRVREVVEIKADGAYVLAPPSLHYTGNTYQWIMG